MTERLLKVASIQLEEAELRVLIFSSKILVLSPDLI